MTSADNLRYLRTATARRAAWRRRRNTTAKALLGVSAVLAVLVAYLVTHG